MSIDPYDHVICIKCYYRDLLVKMLKFAFLGVYGYTLYQHIIHIHHPTFFLLLQIQVKGERTALLELLLLLDELCIPCRRFECPVGFTTHARQGANIDDVLLAADGTRPSPPKLLFKR